MHWLKNYNPLPRWMLWNILLVPFWVRLLMWSIPVYKLPVCKLKLANYALTQIITRFLNGCSKIDALVRKLGNNWSAFKTVRQSFNFAILVCLFCIAWFYTGSNKKQVDLGWIGTNLPGARKGELAPLEKVKHQLIVWTFEIVIDEKMFYLLMAFVSFVKYKCFWYAELKYQSVVISGKSANQSRKKRLP